MTQNRQPRGIPAGGEFAANSHDEAQSSLVPTAGSVDESVAERLADGRGPLFQAAIEVVADRSETNQRVLERIDRMGEGERERTLEDLERPVWEAVDDIELRLGDWTETPTGPEQDDAAREASLERASEAYGPLLRSALEAYADRGGDLRRIDQLSDADLEALGENMGVMVDRVWERLPMAAPTFPDPSAYDQDSKILSELEDEDGEMWLVGTRDQELESLAESIEANLASEDTSALADASGIPYDEIREQRRDLGDAELAGWVERRSGKPRREIARRIAEIVDPVDFLGAEPDVIDLGNGVSARKVSDW